MDKLNIMGGTRELAPQATPLGGDLQDGEGVRREDHLSPQKYTRNTSKCGTTPTEHLLNAGKRPQTSQKTRNSPLTWPCG